MNQTLSSGDLIAGLLDAYAYDHPTDSIEILETHISWVILTGPYAYKVKKPVDLGFLDFTSLDRRKHFCDEELRLNKRLSGDLYVDVVPIGLDSGRSRIGAMPAGEYAVKMQQFGRQDRLDQLLLNNQVTPEGIESLARRVAAFHKLQQPVGAETPYGSVNAVGEHISDNFAQLTHHLTGREIGELELLKLRTTTEALLHRHANTITERKQLGAVRDCHGDLHARNIVRFQNKLIPFDCLEFDPSLRCIDVLNEVAFLVMDLLAGRRTDMAYAFLNAYLEETGDYDGIEVLRLYLAYRCLVRAKVEVITDAQRTDKDAATYVSLRARYLRLAQALLLDTQKPWIIVMHGYSGSGKSCLADGLSAEFPAIRVRSDVERKRMHGLDATASSASALDSQLYSPEQSNRTYRRLASIAQTCIAEKFNVIIDAACLHKDQRMVFRDLARNIGARLAIVRCSADPGVLEKRVAGRAAGAASVSEAGIDVLRHQLKSSDPLDANELEVTVDVATDAKFDVAKIAQRIRRTKTS